MTRKGRLAIAILAIAVGLFGIGAIWFTYKGPRDVVSERYRLVSQSGDGKEQVFHADDPASVTAERIASTAAPAQTIMDPAGVFYRYDATIVAVTPAADGAGSTVFVDPPEVGYKRWFPYVGGLWALTAISGRGFAGGGTSYRGGGPGGGGK